MYPHCTACTRGDKDRGNRERETLVIDLILLCSGAMVPLPDRPLSSLMMRSGGSLVLFDCGEGTQTQIRRFHWGFRKLDVICLSHLHADHVAGLPGLLHTVANAGRTEPLRIYGPVGTRQVVHGLRVIARWLPFEVLVTELSDGDTFPLVEGLRASVCEASHRIECLAWRVDADRAPAFAPARAEILGVPRVQWSKLQRGEAIAVDGRLVQPEAVHGAPRPGVSFAFVTDTRPSERIVELVAGVDLLVSESTYLTDDHQEGAHRFGHMTLTDATAQARAAKVRNLWLTHFSGSIDDPLARSDAARALFPAAEIGWPGRSARISFTSGYERVESFAASS